MNETGIPTPTVPEAIAEWVRANPLPTCLLTEAGQPLVINDGFTELLDQSQRELADLLGELLPHRAREGDRFSRLQHGECLVKQLRVTRDQQYTFHLVKLALSGGTFLCCMVMPIEDPSEARFNGILNAIACFIMEIDAAGTISYINDPLRKHLGYATEDLPTLQELRQVVRLPQEELDRRLEEVRTTGGTHFRGKFLRKEGTVLPMEVSIVVNQTPNDSLFLLTARDIGAQLIQEAAMNEALRKRKRERDVEATKNRQLQEQLDGRLDGTRLVYHSEVFAQVMHRIYQVAPTNTTVLITGETGTGKELIAKTIHRLSRRADQPFVTVDCGSLPPELVESELFGYRKGSFTGTTGDRKGRFGAANGGTLFLDEIGEMPVLLQTRLLRVLQEGQFTAVGGERVDTVDVRVLAATNQDLRQLVAEGKFREDLFYRLNVFPIKSIPLRDRKEDVYPLVQHFIRKFNLKFGKQISGVDGTTLERLEQYSFPGNIRELENMVERAFILATDKVLPLDLPAEVSDGTADAQTPVLDLIDGTLTEFLSFDEYQRKYIQLVLDSTDGKVSGRGGAAEILQIHPQTLFSKMRKLGIRR